MDQYFTKHWKSLQNGLYWSFGFFVLFNFFFFSFFSPFFRFFLQTYTVVTGEGGKSSRFNPSSSKIYNCQKKKKKEAIGLVSGLFTENSWPSPKGPVSSPTKRRRSLTATPLAVYQHLMKVRGKQQWTLTPPSPLLYSIEFPYSKHIHFFFKQLSDSKVPHPHKEK